MPTGSFKDRGASVMLSLLRDQGVRAVLEDSSGNGGAAVAAYAAAGGMARHDHGPRIDQPGQAGADARAWRDGWNWCPERGRTPRMRPCAGPTRSSMPATTGIRSSCRAPRRWPMNFGRISASARRTTSSRRVARVPTCLAARSALPNCSVPVRSRRCLAFSRRSRRTAGRSPRRFWPAPIRRLTSRSGRRSPKAPRSPSRSGCARCSARCAKHAAAR